MNVETSLLKGSLQPIYKTDSIQVNKGYGKNHRIFCFFHFATYSFCNSIAHISNKVGIKYILRRYDGSAYPGISRRKICLQLGSICTTFAMPVLNEDFIIMKYSAFHRMVRENGWRHIRTAGSHYIYEKDGRTYPVPFHGSKEIGEGLRKKIIKEMSLC